MLSKGQSIFDIGKRTSVGRCAAATMREAGTIENAWMSLLRLTNPDSIRSLFQHSPCGQHIAAILGEILNCRIFKGPDRDISTHRYRNPCSRATRPVAFLTTDQAKHPKLAVLHGDDLHLLRLYHNSALRITGGCSTPADFIFSQFLLINAEQSSSFDHTVAQFRDSSGTQATRPLHQ